MDHPRPGRWAASATIAALVLASATACSGSSGAPVATPTTGSTASSTDSAAPVGTPTPAVSAASLLRQAVHDAIASGSVHVVSTFHRGKKSQSFIEDAAVDRGRQRIQAGPIHAEVIQIKRRAFISGNDAAMVKYFGLPQSALGQFSGRSVLLTPADSGYPTVTKDVTIGSVIPDLIPSAPLTETTATLGGRIVTKITGRPPASEHPPAGATVSMYISRTQHPLPLRQTMSSHRGISATTTLSRWGEHLSFAAPTGGIPISRILGR